MRIVPYDLNKVKKANGYRKSENQRIIEEFLESKNDCVKIEGWPQKNAMVCAASLNKSIELSLHLVIPIARDAEKLYIIVVNGNVSEKEIEYNLLKHVEVCFFVYCPDILFNQPRQMDLVHFLSSHACPSILQLF